MNRVATIFILIFFCFAISGCNTIAGTAKGFVEDDRSVIPVIQMLKIITLLMCLFLFSCNTIVGGVKGVGRDIKAATVYSRDALTGNPVSDESSK